MSAHQPEVLKWAAYLEGFFISEEVSASTARKIAAELRRLHQQELALIEWLDKTEWVQAAAQACELGQHRADVIRQRLDLVTGQRDELLAAARGWFKPHVCADTATSADMKAMRAAIAEITGEPK